MLIKTFILKAKFKRNYSASELKLRTPNVQKSLKNIAQKILDFSKDPTKATYSVGLNVLCDRVSIKELLK
jgi:hypothetical protein